jgi:hypothetical protein
MTYFAEDELWRNAELENSKISTQQVNRRSILDEGRRLVRV